jgi:pimeloyl-ACP methyl ester carboxylesterase
MRVTWSGLLLSSFVAAASALTSMTLPSLQGRLFQYHAERRLPAFQHGEHKDCVILIGGLTDGPLSLSYTVPLATQLQTAGWSLVMPTLSSSYQGYGIHSLRDDCEELTALIEQLHYRGSVVLMGHSTGCQDSIWFMQHAPEKARHRVRGVVLQGPVSDRDYMATLPDTAAHIALARSLQPAALMPREAGDAPITAARYLSLAAAGGDDDMFSADLSSDELQQKLGHMAVPTLTVCSLADEYVPAGIDGEAVTKRIAAAMPAPSAWVGIAGGNHELKHHSAELTAHVVQFLKQL